MKYNEYYSSSMLGRIGITLRGEEKEPEPDEDEQIILYVDLYAFTIGDFLDTTNKYKTRNLSGIYDTNIINFGGTPFFNTIGHYGFNEQNYWDTSMAYGVAKYNDGTGGNYYVGETKADYNNVVPISGIPSIVASTPDVTDSMKVIQAFNNEAIAKDAANFFHNLATKPGRLLTIFGLPCRDMYGTQKVNTTQWLIPRSDFFTVPANIPMELSGYMHSFANPKTKWNQSGVRAKCVNGVITFDTTHPWVNTTTNFPFDLSPITVDSSMSSTLYMWFYVSTHRKLNFVCTKKAAEKWIDDTNKWIKSVGLDKGMIQLYLDPHIMDIPDWYAESLGI